MKNLTALTELGLPCGRFEVGDSITVGDDGDVSAELAAKLCKRGYAATAQAAIVDKPEKAKDPKPGKPETQASKKAAKATGKGKGKGKG